MNLHRGRVRPATLKALLDEHLPDVVALQEMGHTHADLIERRFGHHRLLPSPGSGGMGIASMAPMRVDVILESARPVLVADIAAGQRTVRIVNVHLTHPFAMPVWRSRRWRLEQVAAIERSTGGAIAVVGDFNTPPGWPLYRRLCRDLADGASHQIAPGEPAPTWRVHRSVRPMLRIDHVFVGGLEVGSVFTASITGSDHDALLVDVHP